MAAMKRRLFYLILALLLGSSAWLLQAQENPEAPSETGSLAYYWQSVKGHLAVMNAAKPVADWLDNPATSVHVRTQLQLSQRIRSYASEALALPDNNSYRRYAELNRPAVVWNVVAAPELSLKAKTWCFPFVGCVSYRGYYAQEDAQAQADKLQAQGLEAFVYGVPAYSTLGYLNWAGGDPLLSTFIHYPEGELARMMFHELAHQKVYANDDSAFNESYATAVERLGGQQWLHTQASEAAKAQYDAFDQRRRQYRALVRSTKQQLHSIYASSLSPADKRQAKQAAMLAMHTQYAQLKLSWSGYTGYDAWMARANNASFASDDTYERWVSAFEHLFKQTGGHWPQFHEQVNALAKLPAAERQSRLQQLSAQRP
jgi:predicted aminopeptidase